MFKKMKFDAYFTPYTKNSIRLVILNVNKKGKEERKEESFIKR